MLLFRTPDFLFYKIKAATKDLTISYSSTYAVSVMNEKSVKKGSIYKSYHMINKFHEGLSRLYASLLCHQPVSYLIVFLLLLPHLTRVCDNALSLEDKTPR